MEHHRYADYCVPRTVLGRLRLRWTAWRVRREQEVPDGRDYTGWRARVVSLPAPGARPGVGAHGVVTGCQGDGTRRVHDIELPGSTWVMALPSRHIELTPPTAGGPE